MKKILSLVLAMLMIFSMVPAVFAAETSESDYQAAIEYLKALELYKGTTDGDAADELVERYQMALFTARMVTGRVDKAYWETDANDSKFTDLEALNAEALGGVCYAAQQGIVNGIGGNEFAPFDNVTYRDAIVMIVRALGFNYPDSGYPWSYVNKARELGVLDGITGVSYTAEVKREVIAQLLYNAINAEIKGQTIAASVFGVEETVVMVTASYDLVYAGGASKSLKDTMVKVSAVDAEGEPIGAEYYIAYRTLGAKNPTQANALVGTTFALTHKGNFAEILAVKSLSQVFENTPSKKEAVYDIANKTFALGSNKYLVVNGDYSATLNNTQVTVNGGKEIKVFQAFGATSVKLGTSDYILAADGNIYKKSNPFTPYAIYSALVDKWFTVEEKIVTEDIPAVPDDTATTDKNESANALHITVGNKVYTEVTNVAALLALTTPACQGFSRLTAPNPNDGWGLWSTKIHSALGVTYDYYKAIASDTDGDGDFDRVTVRPYELLRIKKSTTQRQIDKNNTYVTIFKTESFVDPVNDALNGNFGGKVDTSKWMTTTKYDLISYDDTVDGNGAYDNVYLYRSTGISIDKVPNNAFVVAYVAPTTAVGMDREIEIVEVIGGAQENAEDNAYVFQTYIRGYDSVTNKIIYGANYDTMYFGTYAVKNSSAFDAPNAYKDNRGKYTASTAKYVQQFWNKYVNVYVLNGAVIYIEPVVDADNFVILDSFTDFTEDGLKAMAYSTLDGGYAEVTIGELNGWSLGGYDYELFMLLKQMTDLGLTVKNFDLPVQLNKLYAVRSVDENGAYNLVEPATPSEAYTDKNVYVNKFGYILGVKDDGTLNATSRVPTTDKDLWLILTSKYDRDELGNIKLDKNGKPIVLFDKVLMYKGKLAAVELEGFTWYKAADNQYVAVAPTEYKKFGQILGNTSEGLDYWMYNEYINNYKNETLFNGFYYGHYMTNIRTGAVEFVTYDTELAKLLFKNDPTANKNYIVLTDGAIYPATNKVLKDTVPATVADAAALHHALGNYANKTYTTYIVGAVLDGVSASQIPAEYAGAFAWEYNSALTVDQLKAGTLDLRRAIALNMYENIYDSEFTHGNLDVYYTEIMKELLKNVIMVNVTDTARDGYYAVKASDNKWGGARTVGSATHYVEAYVMYDYANMSAYVFIDSQNPIPATDVVSKQVAIGSSDAKATVTATTNNLSKTTSVVVEYKALVTDPAVTATGVDTSAIKLLDGGATFTVNTPNYDPANVTVTGTVTATKVVMNHEKVADLGFTNIASYVDGHKALVDGKYCTDNHYSHGNWGANIEVPGAFTYDENLGTTGTAKYKAAFTFELDKATDLSSFRIVLPDPNDNRFTIRGFDILVSKDGGKTWTKAGESYTGKTYDKYTYLKADQIVNTVLPVYTLSGDINAEDVTNVAFAITQGAAYGEKFFNFYEFELYTPAN